MRGTEVEMAGQESIGSYQRFWRKYPSVIFATFVFQVHQPGRIRRVMNKVVAVRDWLAPHAAALRTNRQMSAANRANYQRDEWTPGIALSQESISWHGFMDPWKPSNASYSSGIASWATLSSLSGLNRFTITREYVGSAPNHTGTLDESDLWSCIDVLNLPSYYIYILYPNTKEGEDGYIRRQDLKNVNANNEHVVNVKKFVHVKTIGYFANARQGKIKNDVKHYVRKKHVEKQNVFVKHKSKGSSKWALSTID
ncbi:hypothetical protein HRG_014871 [Hirsutella rhossiliensis]